MPRLFTGIEIPPEIALALSQLSRRVARRALGRPRELPSSPCASSATSTTAWRTTSPRSSARPAPRHPLGITIDGLDSFGGGKPRAVFARTSGNGELNALQAEQERLLRQVGLPPETRKFTPHVTLARLRNASPIDVADYIAIRGHFPKLAFTAERFVLYSSRASVGGGPYVVEAAYPLS